MAERSDSRWGGRNRAKAAVRDRVWSRLVDAHVNVGPAFDRIPNFVGADLAAKRLSDLDEWRRARVIKCNPDPPQIPVRLRALYDGKLLFSPVPYLARASPTCASIPISSLRSGSISKPRPRRKASSSMASRSASRRCPSSISVSSAASRSLLGGRTGKGAGFADLEQGIFRELGLVSPSTPIATTVHSSQIVADFEVVMESHDLALHFIATELELIATRTPYPQPEGVAWDKVRPDQFADIPFLRALRQSIESRKRAP